MPAKKVAVKMKAAKMDPMPPAPPMPEPTPMPPMPPGPTTSYSLASNRHGETMLAFLLLITLVVLVAVTTGVSVYNTIEISKIRKSATSTGTMMENTMPAGSGSAGGAAESAPADTTVTADVGLGQNFTLKEGATAKLGFDVSGGNVLYAVSASAISSSSALITLSTNGWPTTSATVTKVGDTVSLAALTLTVVQITPSQVVLKGAAALY